MLKRLYAHNFKAFLNFDWKNNDLHSSLLIGKNGAGKSNISSILNVFKKIGLGHSHTYGLLDKSDLCLFQAQDKDIPLRLELDVEIEGMSFSYKLAFDFPESFKYARVIEERLQFNGVDIITREKAQVTYRKKTPPPASFLLDWHIISLPIIQTSEPDTPIEKFRTWLAQMVIISPIPSLIVDKVIDADEDTLQYNGENLVSWLALLLRNHPQVYGIIAEHLKEVMPDFESFQFEVNSRKLILKFSVAETKVNVDFSLLSDGEKCFVLNATILAAKSVYNSIFCFWDEPDNYLTWNEVSCFISGLRANFEGKSQIMMTTHHRETVNCFSSESTWLVYRESHVEPTRIDLISSKPSDFHRLMGWDD